MGASLPAPLLADAAWCRTELKLRPFECLPHLQRQSIPHFPFREKFLRISLTYRLHKTFSYLTGPFRERISFVWEAVTEIPGDTETKALGVAAAISAEGDAESESSDPGPPKMT